jgi:hypothetical protein
MVGQKKRKSGIPTGNAGEYFVMGELLRRGFDAQLADRNTQGYDILVGRPDQPTLHKVQVKTVRTAPWYVKAADFQGAAAEGVTVYVLLGNLRANKPVRFFLAFNKHLASAVHTPQGGPANAFMPLKALEAHENQWEVLDALSQGQVL